MLKKEVTPDGRTHLLLKLADFGFAHSMHWEMDQTHCGTPLYMVCLETAANGACPPSAPLDVCSRRLLRCSTQGATTTKRSVSSMLRFATLQPLFPPDRLTSGALE